MPMHNKNEMAVFHAMDFEKDAYFYRRRTITKWKIFSSAVCALGFLFGIFVMPQHIAAAETKTSAVTALSSPDVKGGPAMDTRIEQNQVIKVKNVWETLEWVGRRPEELKLAGAETSGNTGIDFSGDWYGHEVKGTAYVKKNYSSPQREAVVYEIFFTDDLLYYDAIQREAVVYEIFFTDDLPYYDAMIRDIEKRYGKPYIQAEEPYVESNGGCVQHDYYWTGKGSIHISVAEKHDFYVFRYHLSEKPKQVK